MYGAYLYKFICTCTERIVLQKKGDPVHVLYIHCTFDFPIHVVLLVCTGVPDGAVDGAVDDAVRLRVLATAGHLMQLYQMRGVQLGCVYWLLAAIYLFCYEMEGCE